MNGLIKKKKIKLNELLLYLYIYCTVFLQVMGINYICNMVFVLFAFSCLPLLAKINRNVPAEIIFFLAFDIVCLFSQVGIGFSKAGLQELYSVFSLTLFLYLSYICKPDIENMKKCIVIGAFTLFIITIIMEGGFSADRFGATVSNSINSGEIAGLVLVILTYYLDKSPMVIVLFLVDFVVLFIAQTRGPMLIGVGLSAMILFFKTKQSKRKYIKVFFIFSVLTIFAIILFKSGFITQYIWRFNQIFDFFSGKIGEGSVAQRMQFKQIGFESFLLKPVMGHGFGTTRSFLHGTYFHDNYIQLMYEVGFLGTVLHYIPYCLVLKKLVQRKDLLCCAMLTYFILDGVFDVFYHSKLFFIVYAICLLAAYNGGYKVENNPYNSSR